MSVVPPIPADLWAQMPAAAQAAVLALVSAYEQRLEALQRQVDELQQQLGQNSRNSSRPPSSDAPAVKRSPPRPPSGKKRGGQPGQAPQKRPPLPPDHTLEVRPDACRRCGQALQGDDPQPLRHQVLELPVFRPLVTEYRLHRLCCPRCGTSTCGSLPAGVPQGQAGPRLQASLALLTGAYRLSKRQAEEVCAELLGVPLSAGRICELEQQTACALDPVVGELAEHVRTQPANVDETSWRQQRQRGWLWVAVTPCVTLFQVAAARAAAVVKGLVGELYHQVLTSDRFSAYNWLPLKRRQLCWAHLRRDFQAMIDRHNEGSGIGADLLLCADALFGWWHRVRDGTLRWSTFRRYASSLRGSLRLVLQAGAACGCAKTAATCREILKLEPALWTFTRVAGIEPTNNAAERALRHAVLWRKSSYGTDSEAGGHFVSNILSVVATCRQQGRHVLDYLTQCCQAHLLGTLPPSLLPQPTE